jgi:cyclic-di-GMP phosphodiesterase, flagellum assembly factor TipF
MIRGILYVTYALIAIGTGCEVGLYGGVASGLGGGFMCFLLCLQLHSGAVARRARKAQAAEIGKLKRAGVNLEKTLVETRAKMDDMSRLFETRSREQSRKIVSELQMLEGLMREFAGRISHKAADEAVPELPPPAVFGVANLFEGFSEPELLETVRASLEENRVDLYLQPIVSLPQRKLRFYEALSRLRSADGKVIMPAQYIRIAAPAGLMSVVDNLLLFRCVQIVRRLTRKNRDIAVFCNISGDTLTDKEFFPQFLEYMDQNHDLSGQIVFEFAQAAVAKAGKDGEANLRYLNKLGFALSMDHVETLAADFARLRELGFRHFKVPARMLVGGMGQSGSAVAAEDIKSLLSRHNLNLIAERIEDEKTVVQLLDFGVDFAQGYLFGEPRAVRGEAMRSAETSDGSVIPLRKAG